MDLNGLVVSMCANVHVRVRCHCSYRYNCALEYGLKGALGAGLETILDKSTVPFLKTSSNANRSLEEIVTVTVGTCVLNGAGSVSGFT